MIEERQRQEEAVQALRQRGVDQAEPLLKRATPEYVLAACRHYDSREGIGPGALVKWIRDHDLPDEPLVEKAAQLRARFDEYARRYPPGAATRWHRDLPAGERADPEDCPGEMIVAETAYPIIVLRCDDCGLETALTPRSLHLLNAA